MDIIGLGDFSICLKDGKTKFSFQIPSTHDIDFVQEIQQKNISTVQVKKAFDGMITPYGFYNQINMNVLRTKSTDMDVDSIDMKILRI
jgi:membrane protease subunit (stomatin/prohibitin family)